MKRHPVILFLMLMCTLGLHSQDSTSISNRLIQFARKAQLFNQEYAQEKVYLHFDNTGYFLGETIWFKAYVVRATDHAFTDMSKTLYVDLLDPEGYLLQNTKLRIENGVCNGEFLLRDSLKAGFYEVRAYTRCMMNFGPEVIFSRVLPIYDAPTTDGNFEERKMTYRKFSVPDKRDKMSKLDRINVSFHPEGGSLIAGMESRVAFKATDKQGKSIDVTGTVLNAKGEEVASFNTLHEGMGYFPMLPDGTKFTAKVLYDGHESKFDLPMAEPSGYLMTVHNLSNKDLRVLIQKDSSTKTSDTLALALTCRGKILDFSILNLDGQGKLFSYKKNDLPDGVCQLTLYDAEGRIRCERLIFNNHSEKANVQIKPDKATHLPYERIRLDIQSTAASKGDENSLSLAVRDGETSNFGNSDNGNITTNLLLSSDLKGYIADPAWYFADSTKERLLGLDLLMMTQGWRRYSWKRMEGMEPFSAKHPIEEGILVDGKVLSLLAKKEKKDIAVMFWMIQGDQSFKGNCTTDKNGDFNFLLDMNGVWDLNLQTMLEKKRKEFRILLNRTFSPEPRSYTGYDREVWTNDNLKVPEPLVDSTALLLGEIKYATETTPSNPEGYKEYTLKEVVKTKRKPLSMQQEAVRKATLTYDVGQVADAHRDIGVSEAPTILYMLLEENPYFKIWYREDGSPYYRYKGKPVHFLYNGTQSELIGTRNIEDMMGDEVEKVRIVEDQSVVQYYYPYDEQVSVIVMLQLFKNGIRRLEPVGIRRTKFQGYTLAKEFYSPVYQPGAPILESDHRRTLYWNPNITLNSEGKAKVEFFNTKNTKKMIFSAEGVSSDGLLLMNE